MFRGALLRVALPPLWGMNTMRQIIGEIVAMSDAPEVGFFSFARHLGSALVQQDAS